MKLLPRHSPGAWYAVERPDGRQSCRVFRSPFRAAEHAMRAARVGWWPDLRKRGVRVVRI